MVKAGELYPNIAESFTGSDGSVYQYPVRVTIPIMYGDGTAVSQMAAISSLRAWQEANPDKALFPKTIYENILRQMIYLSTIRSWQEKTPDSWIRRREISKGEIFDKESEGSGTE